MAGLKLTGMPVQRIGENTSSRERVANDKAPVSGRQLSFRRKGFSYKEKEAFYLELSIMLSAGVDIKSALDIVAAKYKKGGIVSIISGIKRDVIQGSSLSEAIRAAGCFSAYECHSTMIGEETGRLAHVLNILAEHYHKRIKLSRQMLQALSYPAIVLFTAIGAVAFMLKFIVPMFSDVFKRFGGELPALTKFIIQAADIFDQYFFSLVPVFVLAGVLLFYCRNKTWLRRLSSALLLKIPVVGEISRVILMARMSEAMALLLGARVPLVRAVSLVRQMIGFYAIETSLYQVEADLLKGDSLYASLARFPVYDERLLALIKVGEESNKLDFFFEKMARHYADEVEHKSAVLGTILEPVIIIFLGVIVGVVLMALYLPLFELSNNF